MPITERTEDGPRTVESATEARQGETSGHMRWVVALGIIGVVIAFAIGYAVSV
jgi:hypothetical protein